MTTIAAALISLIDCYRRGLLDPFVTMLEVHKLMYFLQAAGEPLRLRYVKALYGPYAENLRHVLRSVAGHLISGYAEGGDAPDKPLALVPGAVEEAERYLAAHQAVHERIDRTTALVEGFETPYGLELLATVHWVVTQEAAQSAAEIAERVHDWSPRKQQFTLDQIKLALQRLREQGWAEQDQA